jgi:hypothetical protein
MKSVVPIWTIAKTAALREAAFVVLVPLGLARSRRASQNCPMANQEELDGIVERMKVERKEDAGAAVPTTEGVQTQLEGVPAEAAPAAPTAQARKKIRLRLVIYNDDKSGRPFYIGPITEDRKILDDIADDLTKFFESKELPFTPWILPAGRK